MPDVTSAVRDDPVRVPRRPPASPGAVGATARAIPLHSVDPAAALALQPLAGNRTVAGLVARRRAMVLQRLAGRVTSSTQMRKIATTSPFVVDEKTKVGKNMHTGHRLDVQPVSGVTDWVIGRDQEGTREEGAVRRDKVTWVDEGKDDPVVRALEAWAEGGKAMTQAVLGYQNALEEQKKLAGKGGAELSARDAEIDARLQAAAMARAGVTKQDLDRLGTAYRALVEAGVFVGGKLTLGGALELKLGKHVALAAKGHLEAFAGVMTHASASAYGRKPTDRWWDVGGVGVHAVAEGVAGVKANPEGYLSLDFPTADVGLDVGAEGEALAGAIGKAEGEVLIDTGSGEFALKGELTGFAGVYAEGTAVAKGKIFGRPAVTAKSSANVSAGVGANVVGEFSIRRGVLTMHIGGSLVTAIGGGLREQLIVDFKPFAAAIMRLHYKERWRRHGHEATIAMSRPASVKDPIKKDLKTYADFKARQLSQNRADHFVKIEKVQNVVDKHVPRPMLPEGKGGNRFDSTIVLAIQEAASRPKLPMTAKVQKAKILELVPGEDHVDMKRWIAQVKTGDVVSKKTGEDIAAAF